MDCPHLAKWQRFYKRYEPALIVFSVGCVLMSLASMHMFMFVQRISSDDWIIQDWLIPGCVLLGFSLIVLSIFYFGSIYEQYRIEAVVLRHAEINQRRELILQRGRVLLDEQRMRMQEEYLNAIRGQR